MALPTQDDVLSFFDTLSNRGRWGDDERGTLNHITDDVRSAATRAVRHGRSVSFASEVAVPDDMERSTTTCPCAADMPGAENMPCRRSAPWRWAGGRWTTAVWRRARRRPPSSASGIPPRGGAGGFAGTSGSPVNPTATF